MGPGMALIRGYVEPPGEWSSGKALNRRQVKPFAGVSPPPFRAFPGDHLEITKTFRGWILDDQGWAVLFATKELLGLGINPAWDPWAEHRSRKQPIADVLYNAALEGRGERQKARRKWWIKDE